MCPSANLLKEKKLKLSIRCFSNSLSETKSTLSNGWAFKINLQLSVKSPIYWKWLIPNAPGFLQIILLIDLPWLQTVGVSISQFPNHLKCETCWSSTFNLFGWSIRWRSLCHRSSFNPWVLRSNIHSDMISPILWEHVCTMELIVGRP